jgi:hypothetical protein
MVPDLAAGRSSDLPRSARLAERPLDNIADPIVVWMRNVRSFVEAVRSVSALRDRARRDFPRWEPPCLVNARRES